MRVLFLSRCAKFDGTSSLSNVPRLVLHRMLLDDPGLHLTWVVPKTADDEVLHRFLLGPLPEEVRPRLRIVKATGHGFDRLLGYFSTDEIHALLNQATTAVPYDLVVSQQAAMMPAYKALLMNRMRASRFTTTTPWVLWHIWTATLSQMAEVPEYYMGEADVAAELMGVYHADLNVWESGYLLNDALRSLRTWFQPAVVRKAQEASVALHVGVDVTRLRTVRAGRAERAAIRIPGTRMPPSAGPGLLWGGRFANQKKPRVSVEQMAAVEIEQAAAGRTVNCVVSSSQPVPDWLSQAHPHWRMTGGNDRDRWFDELERGDVFLCNSVSEGYGTAWLEMLGAGLIGVFERSWWNEQLLPDWYPFITDDKREQVAIARVLLDQWPDGPLWSEYVPRILDWIESEQSDLVSGPMMASLLDQQFQAALRADVAIGTGTIGQLAHQAALRAETERDFGPVPEEEVYAHMAKLSDADRVWGQPGDFISRAYLRRALQANGWQDTCSSDQVEFCWGREGTP
jgi:hypothetical protein